MPDRPRRPSEAPPSRGEIAGAEQEFSAAIAAAREALAGPGKDPNQASFWSDLGVALQSRFEVTGVGDDLTEAVAAGREAVGMRARTRAEQAKYMSNLSAALQTRFKNDGAMQDLNEAIDLGGKALRTAGGRDPDRPAYLSNLGAALQRRFEITHERQDLDKAIRVGRKAVNIAPQSDRAMYLSNLGLALRCRFEVTDATRDLDKSIAAAKEAVEMAAAAGDPNLAMYYSNLGDALHSRFELSEQPADLDIAIEIGWAAIEAAPEGHPGRAEFLCNLGEALYARGETATSVTALSEAAHVFRDASAVIGAPIDLRASAAYRWGWAATASQQWAEAAQAYSVAVDLAALVASRQVDRTDRERRLATLSGLGSAAAAACLQAGQADRAVELFEQGRAVMFSQTLDARSDLGELHDAHPALAEEFARCREAIDIDETGPSVAPVGGVNPAMRAEVSAQRRREAGAAYERVLAKIRAQKGFERFLMPRPFGELIQAAAEGPVVLINYAELRSDALILTRSGVEVLPLPGVSVDAVAEQVSTFLDAVNPVHRRIRAFSRVSKRRFAGPAVAPAAAAAESAEVRLRRVLVWLGEHVTAPVLDHLGYIGTPPEESSGPRVWWCPSGALAMLPMHAAGHPGSSGAASGVVIDRAISSTTPTLRALLKARHTPAPTSWPQALVVAMPRTPRQPDLPGVFHEVDTLQTLMPDRVQVLGLTEAAPATYNAVTAALSRHPWVHFACHGTSDLTDPSASCLLLDDYEHHPLTVLDLTHARLEHAEMAFLSACTTARTGLALPDEPIHLAAACLLAGYRHVVASLWPIIDSSTATLTADYYRTLLSAHPSSTSPAVALHHATRRLRAQCRDKPSHWAPYTHTGP
jgi:tetratricopeptide (TPR) repeat protein